MRRLVALAAWVLAACAASADAGDLPPHVWSTEATACVPSADETVWLPAPGGAVAVGAREGGYGKSCDGARDERWVVELVDAGASAFHVQATAAAPASDVTVELAVYGWVAPRWIAHQYVPGHWQRLGGAAGPSVAWLTVDAADDARPYSLVRVAARAAAAASSSLPVTITVAR